MDPTIRFECDINQAELVNEEKKRIYEPCIPDILAKCKLKNIEIIGVFIGARGTITNFFKDFSMKFKIPKSTLEDICINVVRGSIRIYHHHIYDPNKK